MSMTTWPRHLTQRPHTTSTELAVFRTHNVSHKTHPLTFPLNSVPRLPYITLLIPRPVPRPNQHLQTIMRLLLLHSLSDLAASTTLLAAKAKPHVSTFPPSVFDRQIPSIPTFPLLLCTCDLNILFWHKCFLCFICCTIHSVTPFSNAFVEQ